MVIVGWKEDSTSRLRPPPPVTLSDETPLRPRGPFRLRQGYEQRVWRAFKRKHLNAVSRGQNQLQRSRETCSGRAAVSTFPSRRLLQRLPQGLAPSLGVIPDPSSALTWGSPRGARSKGRGRGGGGWERGRDVSPILGARDRRQSPRDPELEVTRRTPPPLRPQHQAGAGS